MPEFLFVFPIQAVVADVAKDSVGDKAEGNLSGGQTLPKGRGRQGTEVVVPRSKIGYVAREARYYEWRRKPYDLLPLLPPFGLRQDIGSDQEPPPAFRVLFVQYFESVDGV